MPLAAPGKCSSLADGFAGGSWSVENVTEAASENSEGDQLLYPFRRHDDDDDDDDGNGAHEGRSKNAVAG